MAISHKLVDDLELKSFGGIGLGIEAVEKEGDLQFELTVSLRKGGDLVPVWKEKVRGENAVEDLERIVRFGQDLSYAIERAGLTTS